MAAGVKGKWLRAGVHLSREAARLTSGETSGKTPTFSLTAGGKTAIFRLLHQADPDAAHSRYNALVRRLVSFERAAECVR
jgi:hypothetical protein